MQSARTITLEYVYIFLSYVFLKFVISSSVVKSCPLYNFKTNQDIFMNLYTNINQH